MPTCDEFRPSPTSVSGCIRHRCSSAIHGGQHPPRDARAIPEQACRFSLSIGCCMRWRERPYLTCTARLLVSLEGCVNKLQVVS